MSTNMKDVLRKIDPNLKMGPPKDIPPKEEDPELWNVASVLYWRDRKDRQGLLSDPLEDFADIHWRTQLEYMRRVEVFAVNMAALLKRYSD